MEAAALGKARLKLFVKRHARLAARRKTGIDLIGADRRAALRADHAIRRDFAHRVALPIRHEEIALRIEVEAVGGAKARGEDRYLAVGRD